LVTTRGYADSPLGQVHWQEVRPKHAAAASSPVYVLLHQVPWFHVYYTRAQAELAARGFRSIAIDLPGYGLSARPAAPPQIADYADAVAATLRARRISRAVVVGHHTGATVGADLALRQPRAVGCLVMHGVPLYTAEQAAARLANPHWDQTYRDEAAHLAERWTFLSGRIAGSLDSLHWSVLSLYLAGDREWYGHHAVFRYDMAATLRGLRQPAVVLSNPQDLLDFTFERVREIRPDFAYSRLASTSSNMAFDDPIAWVDAVVAGAQGCTAR
jgi:pimeloyl-ACP methyl ester carboxylesterase